MWENALSLRIAHDAEVWACFGHSNLTRIEIPDHVTHLTLASDGDAPGTPAEQGFEPDEWKALLVRTDVSWDPGPEDEPTLYPAMHLIARLGGYQDRKREPGTQTIWRGLQRIEDMAQVFGKAQGPRTRTKTTALIMFSRLVGYRQSQPGSLVSCNRWCYHF